MCFFPPIVNISQGVGSFKMVIQSVLAKTALSTIPTKPPDLLASNRTESSVGSAAPYTMESEVLR